MANGVEIKIMLGPSHASELPQQKAKVARNPKSGDNVAKANLLDETGSQYEAHPSSAPIANNVRITVIAQYSFRASRLLAEFQAGKVIVERAD